jgi:nitrous oxidase accessory protein
MRSGRIHVRAWVATFAAACALGMSVVPRVRAATVAVAAGGSNLATAIAAAQPGDVLTLAAGVHNGPVHIEKPLTLAGLPGAVLDGRGIGRTIEVTATDVTVRNLSIRGSGMSLENMDAAVFLNQSAARAHVLDNDIEGNLVGVYIHGAPEAVVRSNTIVGRVLPHLNDSGNGVYLWNAPGAQVADNDISGGRDGIFTNTSHNDSFTGNRIHGVRFAVHYMYTNDSQVSGNTSVGNHAGFVIMYSTHLIIRGNVSNGDRDHGLLFNYANASEIDANVVRNSDKCVFIYNANRNHFRDNLFEGCRVGVHFTAGSEGNDITGNAFVNNETQVMYVGTRFLDWSAGGRGNYWSDNPAFDLNGDGVADTAYRPNNIMDEVIWRAPAAKLLLNSPAARVVRWAQSQFPAIHPGGVIDSAPLMSPPRMAAAARLEGRR